MHVLPQTRSRGTRPVAPPWKCGFFKKSGRLLHFCSPSGVRLHVMNKMIVYVSQQTHFQGTRPVEPPLDVRFLQKVWQTFSCLQSVWSPTAHNEENCFARLTANPFPGHAASRPPPGSVVSSKSLADFYMSAVGLQSVCTF